MLSKEVESLEERSLTQLRNPQMVLVLSRPCLNRIWIQLELVVFIILWGVLRLLH